MADKTGIEWTNATQMVRADSGTVRLYHRKDPSRPGQQLRRLMLTEGKKWCFGCRAWLLAAEVGKNGKCRPHENEAYRKFYRQSILMRRPARSRKNRSRGIARREAIAHLHEQFDGRCAYCPRPAATLDHIDPIIAGGQTKPGNIVPACQRCNSSKRDRPLDEWAVGRDCHPALFDVIVLSEELP